jgi:5-methylcytosine-specific restriction endonuclease McrA
MSLRPCLSCGALTRTGSYCAKHRPPRSPLKQRSGGRQHTFRRKTLQRYGLRCIVCGSTDRVEAHHVNPLGDGGEPEGEGVPLCLRCHRRVTAAERRARAARLR